jgi:hypothetical protein
MPSMSSYFKGIFHSEYNPLDENSKSLQYLLLSKGNLAEASLPSPTLDSGDVIPVPSPSCQTSSQFQ